MKEELKGYDLAELEQSDTTTIDIMHPVTGDPLPGVVATVHGQDSDIFRSETRKIETKYTEYARRNRGKLMPPEERERLEKAKVVACTESISGLLYNKVPLTDVAEIFSRFPFIYEQVVQGIMDRAGFIKGSSLK